MVATKLGLGPCSVLQVRTGREPAMWSKGEGWWEGGAEVGGVGQRLWVGAGGRAEADGEGRSQSCSGDRQGACVARQRHKQEASCLASPLPVHRVSRSLAKVNFYSFCEFIEASWFSTYQQLANICLLLIFIYLVS